MPQCHDISQILSDIVKSVASSYMSIRVKPPRRGGVHVVSGDHTIVPTHICALTCYNRVVTIVSGQKHVRLCPDTYLVPRQADML